MLDAIHPMLQKRNKVFLFMLLIILFFPWIGCHFSAFGLKKGRGTPPSKIRGSSPPPPPGLLQTLSKQAKGTEKMMMILAVMQKVLEHSRVGGVIINNQILHAFRKKIPCPQEAFKNSSHKGGKSVQKLLTYWEFGPKCRLFKLHRPA